MTFKTGCFGDAGTVFQGRSCALAHAAIHVDATLGPTVSLCSRWSGLDLLECYYGVVKFDALFMTKTSLRACFFRELTLISVRNVSGRRRGRPCRPPHGSG